MIVDNKTILITGGTGSLGKVLVKRLLQGGEIGTPKKVIVFSRDEGKQHDMRVSYLDKRFSTDEVIYKNFQQALEFRIGDIRSYADVRSVVDGVDILINAAALKQVPTCEYFPEQAIQTNAIGVHNIIRAINESKSKVEILVGISTDKAAKPINVMGMTKALQERIVIAGNITNPNTRSVCVRYGNVIASRGSVIPLFHHQIENGGPITLTVPEMTRFLLTLNQAVDTIFSAIETASPGEILVPNAPSVTVMNLAKALIEDRDVDIEILGIRPGEKLHEIMVSDEESNMTSAKGDYYAIRPMLPELLEGDFIPALNKEFSSADNVLNYEGTKELLKKHSLLPGMERSKESGELLV
jgi:FlaA1/EpsC-like NDP-sugar epimerase